MCIITHKGCVDYGLEERQAVQVEWPLGSLYLRRWQALET